MESLLPLIAPLLLLLMNETVLPKALKWFASWEGHIGAPQLDAAMFVKLASFVVSLKLLNEFNSLKKW